MKIPPNERRKIYCVAFGVLCQECFIGLFNCAFCLACWQCMICQTLYRNEDNTSNYNEDVRMYSRIIDANRLRITKSHAKQDEPDSEDDTDSDDSSQWFTARSFTHKADKNRVEETMPLIF